MIVHRQGGVHFFAEIHPKPHAGSLVQQIDMPLELAMLCLKECRDLQDLRVRLLDTMHELAVARISSPQAKAKARAAGI